jgi:hypothetical protein
VYILYGSNNICFKTFYIKNGFKIIIFKRKNFCLITHNTKGTWNIIHVVYKYFYLRNFYEHFPYFYTPFCDIFKQLFLRLFAPFFLTPLVHYINVQENRKKKTLYCKVLLLGILLEAKSECIEYKCTTAYTNAALHFASVTRDKL